MTRNKDSVTVKASDYARIFDETNPRWERNPEYNLLFLKNQQNYMNDVLHVRGHVFLNDVYDVLGFKRTSAGAVVGWLATGKGDGHISFEIEDHQTQESMPYVRLNFNVNGIIYDKIESE